MQGGSVHGAGRKGALGDPLSQSGQGRTGQAYSLFLGTPGTMQDDQGSSPVSLRGQEAAEAGKAHRSPGAFESPLWSRCLPMALRGRGEGFRGCELSDWPGLSFPLGVRAWHSPPSKPVKVPPAEHSQGGSLSSVPGDTGHHGGKDNRFRRVVPTVHLPQQTPLTYYLPQRCELLIKGDHWNKVITLGRT